MKFFFFITLGSLILLGNTSGTNDCKLKTEGIYYAEVDSTTSAYLRFYSDGTIIHTTSVEDVNTVSKYFDKSYAKHLLKGEYSYGKCYVTASTFGKTGKMKFSGNVTADTLYLKTINSRENTSTMLKFAFHEDPIEMPKKK